MHGSEPQVRKDSRLFEEMCSALLRRGHSVQFRVHGESMRPNLLDGDDVVVVPAGAANIQRGDVVLTPGEFGLRVHRVTLVDADSGLVITRGDSGLENDAPSKDVLGKVVAAKRDRKLSVMAGAQARMRHALRALLHRLKLSWGRRLKQIRSVSMLLAPLVVLGALINASPVSAQSLTITDTAVPSPTVLPGGTITYTQVLSNTSGVTVTRPLTVTQNLPPNTTYVSAAKASGTANWTCALNAGVITCTDTGGGAYTSGSSTTFTVVITVNASVPAGTAITDTVNAQGANTAVATSSAIVSVQPTDLSLTQTPAPTVVAPGANYAYSEIVTNHGPTIAGTGTITISTQTPSNTTYQASAGTNWSCGTHPAVGSTGAILCTYNAALNSGANTSTLTLTMQVAAGTTSGTIIENSSTAADTVFVDPIPSNNTDTSSVTVEPGGTADLQLTETASPSTIAPGTNYVYTDTVTDNGPTAVTTGTITVSTQTPPNTTFQAFAGANWACGTHPAVGGTGNIVCTYNTALAAGATASALTITVQAAAATAAGTVIQSSATVSNSSLTDPISSNNTDTTSVTVETAGTADLQLIQNASSSVVAAGQNITYTEVVTDKGPTAAATGTITAYMQTPPDTTFQAYGGTNWTCSTPTAGNAGPVVCTYNTALASGATASALTIIFQVSAGTAAGTTIQASATVTNSTLVDPIPSNNTSLASTVVEPATSSDLALSMAVSPTPVFIFSNLTYTIQVQNLGQLSAPVSSAVLTDTLPAGVTFVSYTASSTDDSVWTCSGTTTVSCSITSSPMTLGAIATISITVTAPSTATTLSNTATVSLAGDPNSANNSATAYTVVQPLVCASPGRDGAGGTLTGIVNTYFPPSFTGTLASASASVALGASSGASTPIAVGDLLLIIQMQGATINSTNTSSYGDGLAGDPGSGSTSLGSSGLFEFVTATSAVPTTGGTLQFTGSGPTGGLLNSYSKVTATTTQAQQTYEVIRVPQYTSATLSSGLVPLAWNGSLGGVLAVDVSSQLTLGGVVSVDGFGFRGGAGRQLAGAAGTAATDYVTSATTATNGSKGEGIAGSPRYSAPFSVTTTSTPIDTTGGTPSDTLPGGSYARGAPGNAGGGGTDGHPSGNDYNSGGGAGGNGGAGGQGGYGWDSMAATNSTDGGFGGAAFPASTSALVLGGGGGAGTTNNGTYYVSGTVNGNGNGIFSSGGYGGGIVIVHAGSVAGSGTITANGQSTQSTLNDSTGGAGAGGSILVFANSGGLGGLTVSANGGNGGNAWPNQAPGTPFIGTSNQRHGPGGGGAGGVIFLTAAPGSSTVNGGANGYTTTVQDSYGATPGGDGVVVTTHVITETPGTQSGAYCASADLSVTNSAVPTVVAPGGAITYTQVVKNAGPLDAVNAVFSESIPANTTFQSINTVPGWICVTPAVGGTGTIACANPNFASGGSVTLTPVVLVGGATPAGTVIVDVDNITSGTNDPNLTNNTATAITTVGSVTQADLAVTTTASSPTVTAGSNVTMSAVVTNNGPAAASGVVFTETIPADTTLGAAFTPPAGWSCNSIPVGGTGTFTCTDNALASLASSTFAIVLNVNSGTASGTVISDTANIASPTPDPNSGNNSATATTIVATAGQADLAVSSSGLPNPVTPGNNITYTQSVTNNGPTAITASGTTSVTFTDAIPANTTLASAFTPPSGWSCNSIAVGATGTFTCTLNSGQTLGVGAGVNFPLAVKVNAGTAPGTTITNSPSVASSVSDPYSPNNTATVTTIVASPAQAFVTITKTASPEPVNQGTILTYTILVTNNGPAVAQAVTVTDPIPAQVTYASASSTQGTCSYASTTVSCDLGSLGVGSVAVITINVTASVFSSNSVLCNGVAFNSCNTATLASTTSNPNPNTSSSAGSTIQAATVVDLASFHAFFQPDGSIHLEWRTHEESRNLGFHIYREDATGRHRLDPALIAGSALLLRGSKPQHAAKSYGWLDSRPAPNSAYWIEDVDINGTRTLHGPVYAEAPSAGQLVHSARVQSGEAPGVSPTLGQLRSVVPPRSSTRPLNTPRPIFPDPPATAPRFNVADHVAVQISVDQEGWYHIPFAQLFAAGLDVNTDLRSLHLYAEGIEQPLLFTGHSSGMVSPTDAIEFYGTGIDTPFSATRIYWLIRGNSFGKRILPAPASSSGGISPSSFPFTVIRQDRTVYFAALLNGENNDNFFGAVITSDPVDQTLTVAHRDTSSSQPLTLDLTLQGATDQQQHSISIQFNGSTVGTFNFYGEILTTQSFSVDPSLVLDGENTVTLTALNGDNDVSVVQSIQLHYLHTYSADAGWLRGTANSGSEVHISGFSSPQIRVFDITDPLNISQLHGQVALDSGAYTISVFLPNAAPSLHTLVAFSDDALSSPQALAYHTPALSPGRRTGADIVVITHPDFAAHLAPLVNLRESQGYQVSVVTTTQLFDQYNYGERSPFAMRTFLQDAATRWQPKPQAVLLVGDASLDPRNFLGFGDFDFVPTRMIQTAAFKTASDDWFTDFLQNGYATIPTGRLPVRTAADIDLLVSKIVAYEQGQSSGVWNSQALLIADQNVDANFTSAVTSASATLPKSVQASQILADGVDPASARSQILAALNSGALLVDYNGHGAEQQWSFSDLFDSADASALTNGNQLPVYVLIDCLNGLFQDVYAESLAESLILAPNGGAVAVWASSGFTDQAPQVSMNLAFLHGLAAHPNQSIGRLVLNAKAGTTDNDVRRTWILFGDPAMKFHFATPSSPMTSGSEAAPRDFHHDCSLRATCAKEMQ